MEIGAPMAALFLLQNPDYYTSHEFQPFYWKNFVNFVDRQWLNLRNNVQSVDNVEGQPEPIGVDVVQSPDDNHPPTEIDNEGEQTVQMGRSSNNFISKASTDDYRYRPRQHEHVNLYKWIQCSLRHYQLSTRNARQDLPFFEYLAGHPLSKTHVVACDPDRRYYVVPNFLGPSLPRKDKGEREEYCMTMLTLFSPWRTGLDLKSSAYSWEEAFEAHVFTERQLQLMRNFNVRYECYDARDDFAASFKKVSVDHQSDPDHDDESAGIYTCEGGYQDADKDFNERPPLGGPQFRTLLLAKKKMISVLTAAGWTASDAVRSKGLSWLRDVLDLPRVTIDKSLNATAWRQIIKVEKDRLFRAKFSAMLAASKDCEQPHTGSVRNDAFVVPGAYISKDFKPVNTQRSTVMDSIIKQFSLNEGQMRAFKIVANHATCIAPEQLLMHLGGMGGTGKSQVIKALVAFFDRRQEPYRFVLLAPTGTAAALIGGTTYHSFLGFQAGRGGNTDSLSSIGDVIERFRGVGYLLMDEILMVSAINNCRISARCCKALGVYDKPYGGLNVIYAGDFAQLPPVRGLPLYSRAISLYQTPRQDLDEQEKTIGKLIWLQFTTVVILTENMRQKDYSTPEEAAF
ncbi:hypothetical protein EST38_g11058 [Candolleomyces aberdarensis]|uniref:ATP-dependent DNA helicase n=1 Tax=Candolleomyces aberdarensis TaxID=2316362 RepID=A0A4Q2D868_9AGAR|nr:hypothetical protein EST38_g11058 [Candolleomyces aberdarensis]